MDFRGLDLMLLYEALSLGTECIFAALNLDYSQCRSTAEVMERKLKEED